MVATAQAPAWTSRSALYDSLGIRPFINASGHNTAQGGSIMPPEVLDAMLEGARHYVPLRELQDAVGRRIAAAIGVPAAFVTTGAAAAILLGVASALTGDDAEKAHRLPHVELGARREVLVWRSHRPNYMHQACETAGGTLVELGDPDGAISPADFRAATSDRAAAILLILASIDIARDRLGPWTEFVGAVCRDANAAGVPVLVDAASELPPRGLVRQLVGLGVAGVIVSGGKAIRGPQSTGLLLGRGDLIRSAALNNNPLPAVGRPMKVGKEELCGVLAAVERFFAMDEAAQLAGWRSQVERIAAAATNAVAGKSSAPSVEVIEGHPAYGRPPLAPKAVLRFATVAAADALDAALRAGDPAISGLRQGECLILNPTTLEAGEAELVAERLARVL